MGGAEGAMGHTEWGSLVMPLRFGKKLHRRPLLHRDLTGDVVRRPYPVKNGALLRHLGVLIGQCLRLQQNVPSFGGGISAARGYSLCRHRLRFVALLFFFPAVRAGWAMIQR